MALQVIREAVQDAFKKVRHPNLSDPMLVQYNKLQPHDFAELVRKHGEDKTLQYIKDMEAKRISHGRSNT